jgi:hypothetical protein
LLAIMLAGGVSHRFNLFLQKEIKEIELYITYTVPGTSISIGVQ